MISQRETVDMGCSMMIRVCPNGSKLIEENSDSSTKVGVKSGFVRTAEPGKISRWPWRSITLPPAFIALSSCCAECRRQKLGWLQQ